MPNIGFPELLLVLGIILLLFGAKKLPEIARSLGESVKVFKKSMSDIAGGDEPKKHELTKEEGGKKTDA